MVDVDNRAIGIFDSGLGGLTSVRELRRELPNENLEYFGDTARVPYGTRSAETIRKFALQDLRFLLSQDVKAVLVACGTVSSIALEALRKASSVPVYGVVESAAMAAVRSTACGKIAVFGTSATIHSGAYEKAVAAMDADVEVLGVACPLFVPLIENGYIQRDCALTRMAAQEYLKPVLDFGADTLVLGCTHYPLIRGLLEELAPELTLVDSGRAAARSLANNLISSEEQNGDGLPGTCHYHVSDSPDNFAQLAQIFLGKSLGAEVNRVDIEAY